MIGRNLSFGRRLRRRAYWLLALATAALAGCLPRRAGRALGRRLARVAWGLRRRERERARRNLGAAFPEWDAGRRERVLAESVRRLGENLFDGLSAGRRLREPGLIVEEPCPQTGNRPLGEVIAELAAPGRGVLILTGHLGCWELLGAWLARLLAGHEPSGLAVVTGVIHNPPVDRLVQRRRRALGLRPLPRDGGAAPLLRHLRAGGVLAVLLDQNTRAASRPAPFFGRPAPTPAGLARLAAGGRIPVLPVAIARSGPGHVVRHLAPLAWPAGADRDQEIDRFLARCNGALEALIRRNPAEWVWFHRRWEEQERT